MDPQRGFAARRGRFLYPPSRRPAPPGAPTSRRSTIAADPDRFRKSTFCAERRRHVRVPSDKSSALRSTTTARWPGLTWIIGVQAYWLGGVRRLPCCRPRVTPDGVITASAFGGAGAIAPGTFIGSMVRTVGGLHAPGRRPISLCDAAPKSLDGVSVRINASGLRFLRQSQPGECAGAIRRCTPARRW